MEEKKTSLLKYLFKFIRALKAQLIDDQDRWGDTWKHRPREGQEGRAYARIRDYFDQYKHAGVPVPWLKIVGECLICWVRETQVDWDK